MKRSIFIVLIGLIMSLSGCDEQNFNTSKTDDPFLIISHVKESTLTFVDINKKKVIFSEESRSPLSDMVNIGGGKVIATSQSEDFLMLFDMNERTSRPFLKLNQGLTAIHYEPTLHLLFVADIMKDKIHIIDVDKEEVIKSIKVGSFPTDLQVANGTLFVLNGDSNDVTVIDMKQQKVVAAFPVLERPAGMYVDDDHLWIGGHGSFGNLNKSVFVYSLKTGKLVEEIDVGLMPVAFFWDDYSPFLYVVCHGDHAVYKVHKETKEIIDSVEVGQNPNYISGNEEGLFVTNLDSDTVSFIDRDSFELVEELRVPAGPYAIVLEE